MNSVLQTIFTSALMERTYFGCKNDRPQANWKRPTDFCENLFPVKEVVTEPDVSHKKFFVSQDESAAGLAKSLINDYPKITLLEFAISQHNYKAVQAMLKKYIHENNTPDNLSEYSSEAGKSLSSLEKRYVNSVRILYQAFAQYSDEEIPLLIKLCAQALDDLNAAKSCSSLRNQYINNLKLLCSAFGRYSNQAVQALIKKCGDIFGAGDRAEESVSDTPQLDDSSIEPSTYSVYLALLRSKLLDYRGAPSAKVQSLIKACAYALETQGEKVILPKHVNESLERYSKNLSLLSTALFQKNDLAIQALSEICIDDRFIDWCTYDLNREENKSLSPENIAERRMLAIREQYENDLNLLEFIESKQYYKLLPTLTEINIDISGRSMLHIAAAQGDLKTVETLLKHGVKSSLLDKMEMTPLHYAAKFGHYEVLIALLEGNGGKEIDLLNIKKETPLLLATESGHDAIVKLLVNRGANITLTNASGETPYAIATSHLKRDQFNYLLDSGHRRIADFLRRRSKQPLQNLAATTPKSPELQPYA